MDVAEHRFCLGFVIGKIAFARTDEDVEFQAFDVTSGSDGFGRGGEAVEMEGGAEFDTMGAALGGCLGACKVARTDFEDSHGVICVPNTAATETKGKGWVIGLGQPR